MPPRGAARHWLRGARCEQVPVIFVIALGHFVLGHFADLGGAETGVTGSAISHRGRRLAEEPEVSVSLQRQSPKPQRQHSAALGGASWATGTCRDVGGRGVHRV